MGENAVKKKVLLGLSGGVDSTAAGVFRSRIIFRGDRQLRGDRKEGRTHGFRAGHTVLL